VFLFEVKEDKDLIFRSGPYFMDSRGMYLNRRMLDFIPENDISVIRPSLGQVSLPPISLLDR
jgi:hypothetical protein